MRRYVFAVALPLVLALCAAAQPPPVRPNDAGSMAGQSAAAGETPKPELDCQGCHGPGKQLPYLAGALFHANAHGAYAESFHAKGVRDGRSAAGCLDCHARDGDLTTILPARDSRSTINRANIAVTCGRCHGDSRVMQGSGINSRPFLTYQESAHARALSKGNLSAAVCTDCHGSHAVLPASDARSPIFKFNIPQTCGHCHASVAAEYRESVHGRAAARGVSQTPVCTDCHGIHNILPQQGAQTALGTNTCARCHEGVRLTEEFGTADGRVSSYRDSYHGLAKRLGSSLAAECASCHGVHNILPSSDPRSMISQANLPQTCGQCHPSAGESFTRGKVHLNVAASSDAGSTGVSWVRLVYLPLIVVTIGAMLLHNLLAWRKKAAAKLRTERRTVLRLTAGQRVQHWLLLTSFAVLVISGFALVYPDAFFGTEVGEATRRLVHRIAALVMIGLGIYHVAYITVTRDGRSWLRDMAPKVADLKDLVRAIRYYVGASAERPRFGRFGYPEKAEYWAVVWGTVVMGVTGLLIWFKPGFFGLLPRWWVDVAIAIHFYEAVLATLAIVVWHFYGVIFDPDVYPVNLAFYDGRVSEAQYREEHPLDVERAIGLGEEAPAGELAEAPEEEPVEEPVGASR
jgi:formate dehydrogenase gamma subunit